MRTMFLCSSIDKNWQEKRDEQALLSEDIRKGNVKRRRTTTTEFSCIPFLTFFSLRGDRRTRRRRRENWTFPFDYHIDLFDQWCEHAKRRSPSQMELRDERQEWLDSSFEVMAGDERERWSILLLLLVENESIVQHTPSFRDKISNEQQQLVSSFFVICHCWLKRNLDVDEKRPSVDTRTAPLALNGQTHRQMMIHQFSCHSFIHFIWTAQA